MDPDLTPYIEGRRSRRAAIEADAAAWREEKLQHLASVVDALACEFGVTKVVLFGSLARGEATADSDIDLLVEGLDASRLIEATLLAERLLDGTPVDIVPRQLARAQVEGREIHGYQ